MGGGEQLPLPPRPAPRPASPLTVALPEALSMVLIAALGTAGWGRGDREGGEETGTRQFGAEEGKGE